jgi:hypothetical protein
VRHVPWQAESPTAAAAQNRIGGIAAARDAAFASRGTSRVTPGAGARGHAAKTKSVKPKKAKTHGRAYQSALARKKERLASHGRGAEQSSRARLAGGARVHPTTRVKPKDLRLPGPIGERPAHRHGKKK